MHDSHSRLETLPDELFLELFSFIRPIDLYRGFLNLNTRLNHILNDAYLCVHIVNDEQADDHRICLDYFAPQIIYLAVDCHSKCLSYSIHIPSFSNLRSLHLPMPSAEQYNTITPDDLPFLTNLTINDAGLQTILFGPNPFPRLATCCIPRLSPSYLTLNQSTPSCFTLHSLQLGSCVLTDVCALLPHLPNLTYLELILLVERRTAHPTDFTHAKLRHMKVKVRSLQPELRVLLSMMPNLHRLEFLWSEPYLGYQGRESFDFVYFSLMLDRHAASLQHLDIDIHTGECDQHIDTIRQLNPRWFATLSKTVFQPRNHYSFFFTTRDMSLHAEELLISGLLKSTYMQRRNARFNRVKI